MYKNPITEASIQVHSPTTLLQKIFSSLPHAGEDNNYTSQDPWREVHTREIQFLQPIRSIPRN